MPVHRYILLLIVGIGFLLIIFYIVFKSGWRKFRKKWCYRIAKNHDEKMESPTDDIESNLFDEEKGGEQHVTIPTITLIPERKSNQKLQFQLRMLTAPLFH